MKRKEHKNTWESVGVYPTPEPVVRQFADFTIKAINGRRKTDEILDMFAGDGRLGVSIKQKLAPSRFGNLTFLEIRENTIPDGILNGRVKLLVENGFNYETVDKFDLVVSNPPYLSLTAKQAADMGIEWSHAKLFGRNLFSVGISKCLEVCKPGGIVAVIAPFGYLRGISSADFREQLEKQCYEINIQASSDRNLFEKANQDIAFQLFKKRTAGDKRKTKWRFAYNGVKPKAIHVALPFNEENAEKHVRVGPVVWNRKKQDLGKNARGKVPVIYGGNITHDGQLDLAKNKYKSKQYIKKTAIIPTDILSPPFIAIRRTLRGKPGSWIVDSTLVVDKGLMCTAENHTIVAELPDFSVETLKRIQEEWTISLIDFFHHSGSPNISTKIASILFGKIIKEYLENNCIRD